VRRAVEPRVELNFSAITFNIRVARRSTVFKNLNMPKKKINPKKKTNLIKKIIPKKKINRRIRNSPPRSGVTASD
jgi:hypothetical protein